MRICVFCASSAQAPSEYRNAAFELGLLFGRAGVTTVFGGGAIGSMGRLADGVLSVGGTVIGVMPRFMRDLEWAHPGVPSFVWTEDLAERKRKLIDGVDAVVALPGGCGTFEELLEVITLKRLGIFLNPIVIVNQMGYYDPLVALLQKSVSEFFMDERHLRMFTVVSQVDAVLDAVRTATPWSGTARDFANQR